MNSFALKFIVLWGWRRLFVALLAGIVAALAAPPIYLFIALFCSLPVLVWILDGVNAQSSSIWNRAPAAFMTGWAFGFGYFAPNLYWVSEAFLVDADLFSWMIPFVVVLFPLGLGIFYGFACLAASLVWTSGAGRIALLASSFTVLEWVRGHIFTGFPWATMGYSAGAFEGLEQLAAYCGVYGLTFIVVFACASPGILAGEDEDTSEGLSKRAFAMFTILVATGAAWMVGSQRLATAEARFEDAVKVRLVQPNIPQNRKWDPRYRTEIFSGLLELSDMATTPEVTGVKDVTHVIWPESAIPFLLEANPQATAKIAELLPENVTLITGALRRALQGKPGTPDDNRARNSVLVINHEGQTVASYDKAHLVPFGEYLPLASILEPWGLRKMVTLPGGFVPGVGPRSIRLDTAPPVSLLVCYEIIFPRAVIDRDVRPGWILNVTNDAWFGQSIGPRQHFAQSRMRAIEEGLPVVRVANTGISAVVDPYGRVLKSIPLGQRGVVDSQLPKAIPPTFYATFGDAIVFAGVLFGLALAILSRATLARNRPIS
ncbi:MAG: apolipoprotein N-acyltransferase [Pseudomonadota bacterium]